MSGIPFLVVIAIVALYFLSSIKVLTEYERAVVFRLGRLVHPPKGPGITLVFTGIDRMVRILLRTIVHDMPPQDVITRDNVSLRVNAVIYYIQRVAVVQAPPCVAADGAHRRGCDRIGPAARSAVLSAIQTARTA